MNTLILQPTSGRFLACARFNRGLSPEELGRATQLSGRTIRNLEGGTYPQPRTAKRLADFFGLKPTDLWPPEGILTEPEDG